MTKRLSKCIMLTALLVPMLAGCATEHLNTERMLTAAEFVPVKANTPELKKEMAVFPPYTLMPVRNSKKQLNYFFASPARQTVFVGDPKAYKRFLAIQQQQALLQEQRAYEARIQAAQIGQAIAAGMARAGTSMQQSAYYSQPTYYPQTAPQIDVAAPLRNNSSTTRFTPDGFGGYRGSDGSRITSDGFGGYRVSQ